jgi:hypothetical protein
MLLSAAAFADDLIATPDEWEFANAAPTTKTVSVMLVATDEGPGKGCNLIENNQNSYLIATVTSSNTNVVTVSTPSLTFYDCGVAQEITLTAGTTTCTWANVDIAATEWFARAQGKARFSDETIRVRVLDAEGCPGGGGDFESCAAPAAPAWAAAILKANNVKAKHATNLISEVAQKMGPGATFTHDNVTELKSDQVEYANLVHAYLISAYGALPIGPAGAAKPGWVCTSVG